jgi:hypothetical protein
MAHVRIVKCYPVVLMDFTINSVMFITKKNSRKNAFNNISLHFQTAYLTSLVVKLKEKTLHRIWLYIFLYNPNKMFSVSSLYVCNTVISNTAQRRRLRVNTESTELQNLLKDSLTYALKGTQARNFLNPFMVSRASNTRFLKIVFVGVGVRHIYLTY